MTFSYVVVIVSSLGLWPILGYAQRGDRPTEAQPPPDSRWIIPPAPALDPVEEAATFKLVPGFRAELVAADPLIQDPVTLAFGPDGRLWVAEMTGFMRDVDGTGARDPIGNIVVLSDTNGDGLMDKRTVFLDELPLPRAIALVDDGVLVGAPPHLWFARDRDGDDVADDRALIADDYGIDFENVEHLPNGLLWAQDNWIYSANHTIRFRYEGLGRFTADSTVMRGQWGITQDDTGRLYYNANSDPLRFDLLPAEYLNRNPAFPATGARVPLVPRTLRVWPGRITTGINRGYQTLDSEGKLRAVTAACGPVVYRGALFSREMLGDAFVAEPAGHLIKRIRLREDANGLAGDNAYEGTEFMTSTDERFRPVNLFNGPDGALWIVDMYRGFIQDRRFLTTYLRRQIVERGLETPTGLGRIWRIVPDTGSARQLTSTMVYCSPLELVPMLADANGWTRDTAQRLLVEKRQAQRLPAVADALRNLALHGQNPLGRLHALWTLSGCNVLDSGTVMAALDDTDSRVVSAAVRLADRRLTEDACLSEKVIALAASRQEPALRLQLALSLGEMRTSAGTQALRKLVLDSDVQPYLADAVVSGLAGRETSFVEAIVREPDAAQAAEVVKIATSAVFRRGDAVEVERILNLTASEDISLAMGSAILGGIQHFLPKASQGQVAVAKLPTPPLALIALAERKGTLLGNQAAELLGRLQWPGHTVSRSPTRPLKPEEKALFQKGQAQYAGFCAACHQPAGQGMPGLAPALVNSQWVLGDVTVLARIVLHGKTQENQMMPPWKGLLDDESIAAVLTFIRRSWGHEAEPVSTTTVERIRRLSAGRDEPWTDEQLQELLKSSH